MTPHTSTGEISAPARVPTELWITIATHLRDFIPCEGTSDHEHPCHACNTRLRALSETRNFLHEAITPILDEKATLEGFLTRKTAKLITTLTQRKDLARSVRTLTIILFRMHYPISWRIDSLLPHFASLHSLYLDKCTITPSISRLLVTATYLRRLTLQSSRWHKGVPQGWSKGGFGLHLQELVIGDDGAGGGGCRLNPPRWLPLFTPGLRYLACSSSTLGALLPALESETLSIPKMIKFRIKMGRGTRDKERFYQFVQYCRDVEVLIVEDNITSAEYHFPQGILPRLRNLSASYPFFKALGPMDALEVATIRCAAAAPVGNWLLSAPILHSLVLHDVGIWSGATLSAIATRCPRILSLHIQSQGMTSSDLMREIGLVPSLLELHLNCGIPRGDAKDEGTSAELERERIFLIDVKANKCSRLIEARLETGFSWSYDPVGRWAIG